MDPRGWDETMETGDPIVDAQHRAIHRLVDDAESAAEDATHLLSVLDRLMEHVDCHFATEEALMARTGYAGPEADAHVAEHRELTHDARAVVMDARLGQAVPMEAVAEFLRGWLSRHVEGCDRVFIEYVRARKEEATLPEPWASRPLDLRDDS